MHNLIPRPVSVAPNGQSFKLAADTVIYLASEPAEVRAIAEYLSALIWQESGWQLPVLETLPVGENVRAIRMQLQGGLGAEEYSLSVESASISIKASQPAGLFYAIQTLRQLFSARLEIPGGLIEDAPRFAWRGAMLDLGRHFFGVEHVRRFIDLMALYKLNRLHLHLTDDQGWRIMIKSWPKLAEIGGQTAVGGGAGGYFSQDEFTGLVEYARSRYIEVVPEFDMPGHTNAALVAYPELNGPGAAPGLYSGIEVGFSSLRPTDELTYRFIDDVIGELAALTPGPYIHIGGDEAHSTNEDEYRVFIERAQQIVLSHGKLPLAWADIGQAPVLPGTLVQHWFGDGVLKAMKQGAKVILSPANRTYLDMKYDADTKLGLKWAGCISVREAYDWQPETQVDGLGEDNILGVEAALWTETIQTMADVEFMAFPRLAGIAEIGWSPREGRSWDEYRQRLGKHGRLLSKLGVNFFQSQDVDWE